MQILLKGAKFVYSNGLDSVFLKPGGYAKAIEDFNSLNIRQTKFRLPEGTENVCIPCFNCVDITDKMKRNARKYTI